MIPVDSAYRIIINNASPVLEKESVDLPGSFGRFLFTDIKADISIPSFDNSAMDGYAIKYEDTHGASENKPVVLELVDEIQAGSDAISSNVETKKAVRIMTGAPIPAGADAVIPFEDTNETDGAVEIFKSVNKNANIRFSGEDIQSGQVVLKRGDRIDSAEMGLLASLNRLEIEVFRKPRVAIISTGDEIVDIGEDLAPGKIRNSNAYTLMCEVRKYGASADYLGIARDSIEDTMLIYKKALDYDIVISTGGVSMGRYDFVKDVMANIGVEILIKKVCMKPGKPLAFGVKGRQLFFGLPGNPVSTMVVFLQFVRPAILALMDAKKMQKPIARAVLDDEILKKPERMHFIRGLYRLVDGRFHVSSTGPQGSGILRSMSSANCFIILPEGVSRAAAGEEVYIQLFQHGEIN